MLILDKDNQAQDYTIVLSTRYHSSLGQLVNIENTVYKPNLNSADELSFTVYKQQDDEIEKNWEEIVDYKYVYVVELDEYFEIKVTLNEGENISKSITATSAGEAELSQIMLFSLEINSESDIARDDYTPTILYDSARPKASLLDRVLEKCPLYTVAHVDSSISRLQRTFSVSNQSIYDFLTQTVAEEIGCIFIFDSVRRTISVYDLETVCNDCGYRGNFSDKCPECDSKDLSYFGEDTTIYIDSNNLAESITLECDTDKMKNCFKLEAGDDDMTAAVINCNPNGSSYIYCFSEAQKKDMSPELRQKLDEYTSELEKKREDYEDDCQEIYDCIDKIQYYTSSMMPEIVYSDNTAQVESGKITKDNLSPLALEKLTSSTSRQTVENALKNYMKVYVNTGKFRIELSNGVFSYSETDGSKWTGSVTLTAYRDSTDTWTTNGLEVEVNDDYSTFIDQKIKKKIDSEDDDDGSISSVLKISNLNKFKATLQKYCLNRLLSFQDAIQTVIDLIIQEGGGSEDSDIYATYYTEYYNKLTACQDEIKVRKETIASYEDKLEKLEAQRNAVRDTLDFEAFLGEDLYKQFCCYKREDMYSNSNYISDGLSNTELLTKAKEFYDTAVKEITKSCEPSYSITANIYDLLTAEEFQSIVPKFKLGNWLRLKVDDTIYRLRLIGYQISYSDLSTLEVEFADISVSETGCMNDFQDILNQAQSMATTYGAVEHQMKNNSDKIKIVDGWVKNGLDATKTAIVDSAVEQNIQIDNHGMLCRRYNDVEDSYEPYQTKIINNGIYITDDNWKTINTALGKYIFIDPDTGEKKVCYGLQASQIVGELIVGENLIIRNQNNSFIVNKNGVSITMKAVAGLEDKFNEIGKEITDKYDELSEELDNVVIGDENLLESSALTGNLEEWEYNGKDDGDEDYGSYVTDNEYKVLVTPNGEVILTDGSENNYIQIVGEAATVKSDFNDEYFHVDLTEFTGLYFDIYQIIEVEPSKQYIQSLDIVDMEGDKARIDFIAEELMQDETSITPYTDNQYTATKNKPYRVFTTNENTVKLKVLYRFFAGGNYKVRYAQLREGNQYVLWAKKTRKTFENMISTFSYQQTQIATLIDDTQIEVEQEDGTVKLVKLKDKYSELVETVGQIKSSIGQQIIDEVTKQVNTQANTLERYIDKTRSIVSDLEVDGVTGRYIEDYDFSIKGTEGWTISGINLTYVNGVGLFASASDWHDYDVGTSFSLQHDIASFPYEIPIPVTILMWGSDDTWRFNVDLEVCGIDEGGVSTTLYSAAGGEHLSINQSIDSSDFTSLKPMFLTDVRFDNMMLSTPEEGVSYDHFTIKFTFTDNNGAFNGLIIKSILVAKTTSGAFSMFEQTSNGFKTKVEQIAKSTAENASRTTSLENSVAELTSDSKGLTEKIKKIADDGVTVLHTKIVTVDDDGVTVGQSDSEFTSNLNHTGVYLKSYDKMIAKFDNDGMETKDVKITGTITTGNLQIMDVNVNNEKRTYIHFIG